MVMSMPCSWIPYLDITYSHAKHECIVMILFTLHWREVLPLHSCHVHPTIRLQLRSEVEESSGERRRLISLQILLFFWAQLSCSSHWGPLQYAHVIEMEPRWYMVRKFMMLRFQIIDVTIKSLLIFFCDLYLSILINGLPQNIILFLY